MLLNDCDRLATDGAFAFVMVGIFGLMFLMPATDGGSVHGLGLLGTLSIKGRVIGLVGANVIFLIAAGICWIGKGVTPLDLAHGANIWWAHKSDVGPMGYIIPIVSYWILFSPLQSVLAIILIRHTSRKERPNSLRNVYI